MILQQPPSRAATDPGPTSPIFYGQNTIGPPTPPVYADFPVYVDRVNPPPPPSQILTPEQAKAYVNPITFTNEVTDTLLQSIAGRASWMFLAKFNHDPGRPPSVVYVAQTVRGLKHIQSLIVFDTLATWFVECGAVSNYAFQKIVASDIDTLIADFQAIYGPVDSPPWYGNPLGNSTIGNTT